MGPERFPLKGLVFCIVAKDGVTSADLADVVFPDSVLWFESAAETVFLLVAAVETVSWLVAVLTSEETVDLDAVALAVELAATLLRVVTVEAFFKLVAVVAASEASDVETDLAAMLLFIEVFEETALFLTSVSEILFLVTGTLAGPVSLP